MESAIQSQLTGNVPIFHLFSIVADKSMRYQQYLSSRRLAILELWTNHRPTLAKHFEYIRSAAERITPDKYVHLDVNMH